MLKQKITIGLIAIAVIGVIANFLLNDAMKQGVTDEGTGVNIGDTPPQFALANVDDELVKLEQFEGKKIILNFWASWCLPCREEMPVLQQFHDAGDVVVLAVNMSHKDSSRPKVMSFLNEYNFTFPVIFDEEGAVSQAYSIINIPTTVFLNEQGDIGARIDGEVNEQSITEALQSM